MELAADSSLEPSTHTVLICDALGLRFDSRGEPDCRVARARIESLGGVFHRGVLHDRRSLERGRIHFFYAPELSTAEQLLEVAGGDCYDALIAAATPVPEAARFPRGGVRIGSGTHNMRSRSWGGGDGRGGHAPLMNTPGYNARATAHMVMKAILKVCPDLPVDLLHARVLAAEFDTGRHLRDFPTDKLEGRRMAILGYGNIGRAVARIAAAFDMQVAIFARAADKPWIEADGYEFAHSPLAAATRADVLTMHVGLGAFSEARGLFANAAMVDANVLGALNVGSVVVNYDRAELIHLDALAGAVESGRVRHVAVDADIFRNEETREISGPLCSYRQLAQQFPGKFELLPHVAADTDHSSREAGAVQAINQIVDCLRHRRVCNLVGDLPAGYVDAGARIAPGVGRVGAKDLLRAIVDPSSGGRFAGSVAELLATWNQITVRTDLELGLMAREKGAALHMSAKTIVALIHEMGLHLPFSDE